MAINDSNRKARENYKKKVERRYFELYPTDEDIKKRLDDRNAADEPTATYIKRLIREDMKNGG
jgi:hypothetical protein